MRLSLVLLAILAFVLIEAVPKKKSKVNNNGRNGNNGVGYKNNAGNDKDDNDKDDNDKGDNDKRKEANDKDSNDKSKGDNDNDDSVGNDENENTDVGNSKEFNNDGNKGKGKGSGKAKKDKKKNRKRCLNKISKKKKSTLSCLQPAFCSRNLRRINYCKLEDFLLQFTYRPGSATDQGNKLTTEVIPPLIRELFGFEPDIFRYVQSIDIAQDDVLANRPITPLFVVGYYSPTWYIEDCTPERAVKAQPPDGVPCGVLSDTGTTKPCFLCGGLPGKK